MTPSPGASVSGLLQLRGAGGDEADKNQRLTPGVPYLMFFIAGDQDNIAGFEAAPFLIAEYLTNAAVHKDFVFPGMGMPGSMATWPQLENAHAKISGAVGFADDHPCGNATGDVIVDCYGICFLVVHFMHRDFSFLQHRE